MQSAETEFQPSYISQAFTLDIDNFSYDISKKHILNIPFPFVGQWHSSFPPYPPLFFEVPQFHNSLLHTSQLFLEAVPWRRKNLVLSSPSNNLNQKNLEKGRVSKASRKLNLWGANAVVFVVFSDSYPINLGLLLTKKKRCGASKAGRAIFGAVLKCCLVIL